MLTKAYTENRPFDEISIGDRASLTRMLTWCDIELFAAMPGNVNSGHVDEDFAKSDLFHKIIGHDMWGGAFATHAKDCKEPWGGSADSPVIAPAASRRARHRHL